MKQGKRPTVFQMEAMEKAGLNPGNWLVIKNLNDRMHVVHRETGRKRVIPF